MANIIYRLIKNEYKQYIKDQYSEFEQAAAQDEEQQSLLNERSKTKHSLLSKTDSHSFAPNSFSSRLLKPLSDNQANDKKRNEAEKLHLLSLANSNKRKPMSCDDEEIDSLVN